MKTRSLPGVVISWSAEGQGFVGCREIDAGLSPPWGTARLGPALMKEWMVPTPATRHHSGWHAAGWLAAKTTLPVEER